MLKYLIQCRTISDYPSVLVMHTNATDRTMYICTSGGVNMVHEHVGNVSTYSAISKKKDTQILMVAYLVAFVDITTVFEHKILIIFSFKFCN